MSKLVAEVSDNGTAHTVRSKGCCELSRQAGYTLITPHVKYGRVIRTDCSASQRKRTVVKHDCSILINVRRINQPLRILMHTGDSVKAEFHTP